MKMLQHKNKIASYGFLLGGALGVLVFVSI